MYWELEERSLNAWPAVQCLLYDGWQLRFANGITRRSNSVQALSAGVLPLAEKIDWCEEQYRAQGLPAAFKVTPFSQPSALDDLLEARGYLRERDTDVLQAPIAEVAYASDARFRAAILPVEAWFDAYARFDGLSAVLRAGHQRIIAAIVPELCPVTVLAQGVPVAVGLGVLERGMIGIYDLVTDARYRRQGCAMRVMATLFAWAAGQGATAAYLNVMSDNAPAQALYARLGFTRCYRYWYQVK